MNEALVKLDGVAKEIVNPNYVATLLKTALNFRLIILSELKAEIFTLSSIVSCGHVSHS